MPNTEVVVDTKGGGCVMIVLVWLLSFVRLLLVALVALLVIIGLILTLPFHYRLTTGVGKGGWHLNSAIRWAWGLAVVESEIVNGQPRFHVKVLGHRLRGKNARVKAHKPASPSTPASTPDSEAKVGQSAPQQYVKPGKEAVDRHRAKSGPRNSISELRRYLNRPVVSAVLRLLKRLYVSLHLEAVVVKGEYGFDDPTLTGLVAAWGNSLGGALPFLRWRMVPVFNDPTLSLELELRGWLSPSALIWWATEFGLCNAVRPLWFGQLFSRLRRKQKKGSGAHGTEGVSRNSNERPQQDVVVRKRSWRTDYSRTSDNRPRRDSLLRLRDRRRRGEG